MAAPSPRRSADSFSPHFPSSPTFSRNEYPFPRPGSSSNNRIRSRRGSVASSIHSIGGTLDTATHWHDLSESGQNAISTLLQAPIVRTGLLPHTSAPASSAHKPPTSRDIPPVALTNIPTVDASEFRMYLSQVSALYDALQRAKENEEEGGTQLVRKGSTMDDFADILDTERRLSRPSISKRASLASLASQIENPQISRRRSSGGGKRFPHAPTPLSTIPPVYFEDDFHLENPRTFDVVSERSEVVKPAPGTIDDRKVQNGNAAGPRKALATNAILQEKLSWYMDTIEVHLISSISTASTSFFAALGELRELHSEAADSVSRIKALRQELKELDEEMAIGGLEIVNKKRRRENLKQLSDAVKQLKRVVAAVGNCESLVDGGEVEQALGAMDGVEMLVAGEEQRSGPKDNTIQLRDLRGATALQGVTNDLSILRSRIGKIFEARFLSTLLGDLKRHVESVSMSDTLQRWSNASQRTRGAHNRESSVYPTYLSMGEDFRPELLSILTGLHRAQHISSATSAYREAILREVRNITRRALPSSNDDDADSMMSSSTVGGRQKSQQEKSSILARNLRALDSEDAEELLKKTYVGVGETLRRLGFQVKILLDVASNIGEPPDLTSPAGIKFPSMRSPPRSPNVAAIDARSSPAPAQQVQEEMHTTLDLSNLLGQAVDIAQDKIVKVLRVRSEQSTHLPVEQFLRYFTLNLLFATECEAVSGRSGTSLRNVVNGQIKDYVRQLGDSEKQALATGMEADPWNAKDFTDADREVLSRILSASTEDVEAWKVGSKIWVSSNEPDSKTIAVPEARTNGSSGTSTPANLKSSTNPAVIEGESFLLPISAISCLYGISTFLHLNTGIPSMTIEIATTILSYLSTFNSRCTQLILGAGAIRSAAALKNITTKHLALAAQAISFISNLIPHIREFVRRHASTGISISTLMGDFDKVRRTYLEHQQSIYDKLVDIMASRATAQTKAMKLIDWEKGGKDNVNAYMEILTKETRTLHRVLSNYLPPLTVQMIMEPVFKSYKEQWGKAFGDVTLGSEAAQSRMLRDAEHFKARIGGLEGAGNTGDYIVNLVKSKNVPKPKVLETTPAPAANKEASTNGDEIPHKAKEDAKDEKTGGKEAT